MTDELPSATDRTPTNSNDLTEGIGGVPDLGTDQRAMVSDPDGDNVDDGEPIKEDPNTWGAP